MRRPRLDDLIFYAALAIFAVGMYLAIFKLGAS